MFLLLWKNNSNLKWLKQQIIIMNQNFVLFAWKEKSELLLFHVDILVIVKFVKIRLQLNVSSVDSQFKVY
mgnify:CR=1 FL=1